MASQAPAYYRSDDPVENLKIKLILRQISGGSRENSDEFKDMELELSWQEKINGPRDIYESARRNDNSVVSVVRNMTSGGNNNRVKGGDIEPLKNVMLYTYVDKDHFIPKRSPLLVSSDGLYDVEEPYISAAINHSDKANNDIVYNAKSIISRQQKVRDRFYRESPSKTMYVCLATDVDVKTLSDANIVVFDINEHFTEHILFSITLHQDGIVECTPSFSDIMTEQSSNDAVADSIPSSLFIDDATIKAGVKKGFKLSTHRVLAKLGAEFEYCVVNMNEVRSPILIENIKEHKKNVNRDLVSRVRGPQIYFDQSLWKQDPPQDNYEHTICYYNEIVSGCGFQGDNVRIMYEIITPASGVWKVRSGNLTDGVKEEDVDEALRLIDGYVDSNEVDGLCRGTTQLAKSYEISRGVNINSIRPHWKGFSTSNSLDDFTSSLLAYSFFIITVASVVLGCNYPFWLVPSLTFVFVVGTGYPGGSNQVLIYKNNHKQNYSQTLGGSNNSNNINKHYTSGNSMIKNSVLVGKNVTDPIANFNHLTSISYDVKTLNNQDQSAVIDEKPKIFFEVYSTGLFGRYSLEGYGYADLPTTTAAVDVEVKTWRPVGGINSKLFDQFLGNSVRLRDKTVLNSANGRVINKFGVQTESSGTIRFKCYSVLTSPLKSASNVHGGTGMLSGSDYSAGLMNTLNSTTSGGFNNTLKSTGTLGTFTKPAAAVKRTVEDILTSFRSANNTLGGNVSTNMGNITSGSSVDSRLADILARARAKVGSANTSSIAQEKLNQDSTSTSLDLSKLNLHRGIIAEAKPLTRPVTTNSESHAEDVPVRARSQVVHRYKNITADSKEKDDETNEESALLK